MCITADGDLVTFLNVVLDHCRLLLGDVHDCENDLVGILLGNLLAVLEPLDHVFDEVECHLVFQLCTIVSAFHDHVLNVKPFCDRRCVLDLDSLQEGVPLDNPFALDHAQLRSRIVGCFLDDNLPVPQGIAVLQNEGVGRGAAVVCLDIVGVELDRLVGVCNSKSICLDFQVGLSYRVSMWPCAATRLHTCARLV